MRLRKTKSSRELETSAAVDRAIAFMIVVVTLLVALGLGALLGVDDEILRLLGQGQPMPLTMQHLLGPGRGV